MLGLRADADPARVRAAYLAQVKAHPPDRDPEAFERIRDAYRILSDPTERTRHTLLAADPQAPLVSLLPAADDRPYVGPAPWLEALRARRPGRRG